MIKIFDENQLVKINWWSNNKAYYTSLGYKFTKMKDSFFVPAYHLMPGSRALVDCVCDYCGEHFQTRYANYRINVTRGKIACRKCKQKKITDTLLERYNSTSLWGVPEFRERAKDSMKDKYGARYHIQTKEGREKFKKSMMEKYGCDNPAKSNELMRKRNDSLFSNGNIPTSKPEKHIIEILQTLYGSENCIPGFCLDRIIFDCLLIVDGQKIDVEYDGYYWHKDTKEYDNRRNRFVISKGYKVLRILGNEKDELPKEERIKEEIEYILNGRNFGFIDMKKQK